MNRSRVSLLGQAVRLTFGLLLGLGLAVKASAQWLPDRSYSEGPGIRVGELELHPGIAVRGGYDSNVFRSDGKTREGGERPIKGAPVLAVTPHLYLSTETSQRAKGGEDSPAKQPRYVAFRGGAALSYLHYFIEDGPRNLAVDTDFFLAVAQGRPVELNVAASYMRNVAPFTEQASNLSTAKERRKAYVYDTVDPKLRLRFNSRSQVLSAYVGYAPRLTYYESSVFDYLNNVQHGAEVGASWRFLPSTALIYDGIFVYQSYLNDTLPTENLLILSDSKAFRTRLGINGAFTTNLSLRVLAGYAVGFFEDKFPFNALDEFEDAVGEAVLTYRFGLHNTELGYQRDVQLSPLGGWTQTDRGFGRLGLSFAQRFRLGFEVGAGHANYGRLVRAEGDEVVGLGIGGDSTREDIRVDGAVRAEYRATNWLAFMVDFTAQSIMTDFEFELSRDDTRIIPDPASFNLYQVFGGVRAHY